MKFGIYLPYCCVAKEPVSLPILFWLSGIFLLNLTHFFLFLKV